MNDLLLQVLQQFIGSGTWSVLSTQKGIPEPDELADPCLVSLNPSNAAKGLLVSRGYTRWYRFIVLPFLQAPRWLLPVGDGPTIRQSFQIYAPMKPTARILKATLGGILGIRWHNWVGRSLLIASTEALPLERLVREVTGEIRPVFALSLGTPYRSRKLTAQVMRPSGEILGYLKLPLNPSSTERIRHEAEVLQDLATFSPLRSRVPKVLYAGSWQDGYLLFQSGGPSQPGPSEFNALHEDFLRVLGSLRRIERPGAALVEEVASGWRRAEPIMDSGLQALGEAALRAASRSLDGCMVPCGIMHGDFAPWNTRVNDGYLYAFDWELAAWDAPLLWDVYHFQTHVASFLRKKQMHYLTRDQSRVARGSFLIYLVSSLRLLTEEQPDNPAGVEYRRQLLTEILREDSAEKWAQTPC